MPITAQFRTECYECGYLIQPGEQIDPAGDGHWQHTTCPDELPDAADSPCTDCQLVHAGECFP